MRKLKAVLVLATQSLSDLASGPAQVVFDQIANRVYLPHSEALRPQTRALYEAAGLMEEHIQLLARATPKAEYLLQTEEVTRLVEIRLEDEALRCVVLPRLPTTRGLRLSWSRGSLPARSSPAPGSARPPPTGCGGSR